jgi:hypothetical protein
VLKFTDVKAWVKQKKILKWLVVLLIGVLIWQLVTRVHIGPAPVITYICPKNQTAMYALLSSHPAELLKTDNGRIVTALEYYQEGDGKTWQYTVNGVTATVSADAHICMGDETITWELR